MENRNRTYLFLLLIFVFLLLILLINCGGRKSIGKLTFVAIEEELALGKEFSVQGAQRLRLIRNQTITHFFSQLAEEIGAYADWDSLQYKVFIVNEPDINHFSLPGGNIYLFRGLIEASDTASEVALIVAHEMAHLSMRDGVERLASKYGYAFAAQSVIGNNPEIPAQIISNLFSKDTILDYPPSAEFRADSKAIKYAWKANYDPSGLMDILRKVRKFEAENPERVSLLLLTHTRTTSRFRNLNNELSSVPYKSSLRKDLPEFQTVKELLAKIPK